MITLSELEKFLNNKYKFEDFEDYCVNGLVVEGKVEIRKIIFGVSYNAPFLDAAIEAGADAVMVHHGIFRKGLFSVRGIEKEKIKKLLAHDISLLGIHLPMDAHPEYGHNALLLNSAGCRQAEPLKWGHFGINDNNRHLEDILKSLHDYIHPDDFNFIDSGSDRIFNQEQKYGFIVIPNGPVIPEKVFMASGGSTDLYEDAIALGADTFICGEIKEHIPAISLETGTNFINLGHYYSEKPGVIELMNLIDNEFDVETQFIEIPNSV